MGKKNFKFLLFLTIGFLKSFLSLYKLIFGTLLFSSKKRQILFFYSSQMNNNNLYRNQYPILLRPFVKFFNNNDYNNIYYMVEPYYGNIKNVENKNIIKFDFYYILFVLLRKIIPQSLFSDSVSRDQFLGKIISFLALKCLRFDTIITLQNTGSSYLRGICPNATIIDYQHGMFSPKCEIWLEKDGGWPAHITKNNKIIFLWGKGFLELYKKSSSIKNISDYIEIFGHAKKNEIPFTPFYQSKNILITLQYVNSTLLIIDDENNIDFKATENLFNQLMEVQNKFPDYQIILKHHPKSEVVKEIESIFNKIPNVKFYGLSNNKIDIFLHFSFFSTSIFEYSLFSIPTQLISNSSNSKKFMREYNFPTEKNLSIYDYIKLYSIKRSKWNNLINKNKKWSADYFHDIDYNVLEKYLD